MATQSRHRFDRYPSFYRAALTACWMLLFVLGAAMLVVPTSVDPFAVRTVGVMAALGAGYFVVRSFRWGTVEIAEDAVAVRGLIRTSRLSLSNIERFLVTRHMSESGRPVAALAVKTRDGNLMTFDDFAGDLETDLDSLKRLVRDLNSWTTRSSMAVSSA